MKLKSFICVIFVLALVYPCLTAHAQEKKRLAVLEFVTGNVEQSHTVIMRSLIEAEIFKTGEFQLLERENIRRVYLEKNIDPERNINTADARTIGIAARADFVVVGNLYRDSSFRLTIRVIHIPDNSILRIYEERYASIDDADRISVETARRMAEDIDSFIHQGSKRSETQTKPRFFCGSDFTYMYPIGLFHDVVSGGYGGEIILGAVDIGLKNLLFGLRTGYAWFDISGNNGKHAGLVPVLADLGYRYYPISIMYLSPRVAAGFVFIYFTDSSFVWAIEPAFDIECALGFSLGRKFSLEFSAGYKIIFERDGMVSCISAGIGLTYSL